MAAAEFTPEAPGTGSAGAAAATEGLGVDAHGPVLRVCLDRPSGNLMSLDMCDRLAALLRDPPEQAHVLVLSAAGDSFCLGRERTAATAEDLPAEVRRLVAVHQALQHTRLVTVAQIHGDAAGFGVGLAALCDVAIAAGSACFRFPEVGMDLAPTLVLAWLPRAVGRRAAFWLTATGQPVDAVQAQRLGLINEVVDDSADLPDAVAHRVHDLQQHNPRVHAEIRDMLGAVEDLGFEQAHRLAADRLVLGSLRRRPR